VIPGDHVWSISSITQWLRFSIVPTLPFLCLTLSHQYVEQLPLPVRQAAFGNVGTLIAFRLGYADAEVLQKEFGNSIQASAIADLDRYEAVLKLLEDGTNRGWANFSQWAMRCPTAAAGAALVERRYRQCSSMRLSW